MEKVTMAEDNTHILSRIHTAWPDVRVHKNEKTGMWHADVPVAGTLTVPVERRFLASLEDKIGDVINAAERERRRAADRPGSTV